jgi:hypothetical protein
MLAVRDPAEFSDRGFAPEEAEDWIAAFFGCEAAAVWRDAGFEPEEAHIWAETDLEPKEAARWRAVLTPPDSSYWQEPQRDNRTAWHIWREVCGAATWWRHKGFSPTEAERWLKAGFEPQDARLAADYRDEGLGPHEARAASHNFYWRPAHIEMLPSDASGIREPMRTPTRHLVLRFGTRGRNALDIGAIIATDHDVWLEPGQRYAVQLTFWAPEAEASLAGRNEFGLWAGRLVGSGLLTPDPASAATSSSGTPSSQPGGHASRYAPSSTSSGRPIKPRGGAPSS